MMHFAVASGFDFESTEYRQLYRAARTSPFQNSAWLIAHYKHLHEDRSVEPLVLLGRSTVDGKIRLVLPLVRRIVGSTTIVEYAFSGVTDYASPVAHPDVFSQFKQIPLLRDRLIEAIGNHDVLSAEPIRQVDAKSWEILLGTPPTMLKEGSHAVQFGTPFDKWRSSNLGTSRRSQLDRKLRRLNDRGEVRFQLLTASEAASAIVWAGNIRQGRFLNDPLQRYDVQNFYCDVAGKGATSGFTRTYRLSCGDDPVATVFGITQGRRYCYLVLACDYDEFARCSPGILAIDLAMADWAAANGSVFDLTIGDEPFKKIFRCRRMPMFKITRANTKQGHVYLKQELSSDCRAS